MRNAPCPDAILKQELPRGESTVTDNATPPVFLTMKDFVSVTGCPERSILLKGSKVGITAILLTGIVSSALPPLTWASTPAANKSVAAKINDAIVARHAE